MPFGVQVGQRVEDIEAERADLAQRLVHGDREPFEAHGRVDEDRLQPVQGLALAEPHVYEPSAVGAGLGDERTQHREVVLHRVDPPHDVVAEAQAVDGLVEPGVAGAGPLRVRHALTLAGRATGGNPSGAPNPLR